MDIIEIFGIPFLKKGSGIHIKKENRGKFTDYCGGKVTNECILRGKNSSDPKIRKRTTFALNARAWKHLIGGLFERPLSKKEIIEAEKPYTYPSGNIGWTKELHDALNKRFLQEAKIHSSSLEYATKTDNNGKVLDYDNFGYILGLQTTPLNDSIWTYHRSHKSLPTLNNYTLRVIKNSDINDYTYSQTLGLGNSNLQMHDHDRVTTLPNEIRQLLDLINSTAFKQK